MLPSTEKLLKALKKDNLPLEDRSALTSVLMEKIGALPVEETITISPQGIHVNGRLLSQDQNLSFKEGCVSLSSNQARKLIRNQIKYLAIEEGIHKGLSTESILFSKAALWLLEVEDKIIVEIVKQGTNIQA